MEEIVLTFKGTRGSTIPLEADPITPDILQLKFRPEIERLPLYHGNEQVLLGDFFTVKGERSNQASSGSKGTWVTGLARPTVAASTACGAESS
jgi:formylmethanofuran dehydrogenase subunit C